MRSLASSSFSLDTTALSTTASTRFLQCVVHHRIGRRVFWGFTVFLYAATGLFCWVMTLVYWAAWRYRDGYVLDYIGALPLRFIPLVIASYALIGACFFGTLVRLLLASCRARRVVFSSPSRGSVAPAAAVDVKQQADAELLQFRSTEKPTSAWRRWLRCRVPRLPRVLWLRGLDESSRFEIEYVLRELLEISLQTQQCYKSSWLLAAPALNRFYVAVLVLNCWLVPLLSVTLHEQHLAKRLALLAADAALDFSGTIVLPLLLVRSIVLRPASFRTRAVYLFDVPFADDVLVDLILSTQQVAMMSGIDVLAKLLPLVSILGSLRKMHHAMVLASFLPREPATATAPCHRLSYNDRCRDSDHITSRASAASSDHAPAPCAHAAARALRTQHAHVLAARAARVSCCGDCSCSRCTPPRTRASRTRRRRSAWAARLPCARGSCGASGAPCSRSTACSTASRAPRASSTPCWRSWSQRRCRR
ncbi:hypothetical protein PINS_up008852 [Pythium insidiosum]|nr:hypothetical protein PINS_up008852 [Pythium insidiosum]